MRELRTVEGKYPFKHASVQYCRQAAWQHFEPKAKHQFEFSMIAYKLIQQDKQMKAIQQRNDQLEKKLSNLIKNNGYTLSDENKDPLIFSKPCTRSRQKAQPNISQKPTNTHTKPSSLKYKCG